MLTFCLRGILSDALGVSSDGVHCTAATTLAGVMPQPARQRAVVLAQGMPLHSNNKWISIGAADSSSNGAPAAALEPCQTTEVRLLTLPCTFRYAAVPSTPVNRPVNAAKASTVRRQYVSEFFVAGVAFTAGSQQGSQHAWLQLLDTIHAPKGRRSCAAAPRGWSPGHMA